MENSTQKSRSSGRPRKTPIENEEMMVRYYIINKIGSATVVTKAAADSVALYLNTKNTEDFIIIKSNSIADKIIPLFNNMSYNNIIKTLENA